MFIDICLRRGERFFAYHGIKCTPDISFIGINMKLRHDRYRLKMSEALIAVFNTMLQVT